MRAMRIVAGVLIAASVAALASYAFAVDGPLPGLWKVTGSSEADGAATPAQVKTRCLKPEDVQNLEKTFAPEFGAQGAACQRSELKWSGQTLAWRIHCTGALTMDVDGTYEFDTPKHYRGAINTLASVGGREMRSHTTLEGEWTGECQSEDGGRTTEDRK